MIPRPTVIAKTLHVVDRIVQFFAYAVVRHALLTQRVSILSKRREVGRKGLYRYNGLPFRDGHIESREPRRGTDRFYVETFVVELIDTSESFMVVRETLTKMK